jgi:hypothetical protein
MWANVRTADTKEPGRGVCCEIENLAHITVHLFATLCDSKNAGLYPYKPLDNLQWLRVAELEFSQGLCSATHPGTKSNAAGYILYHATLPEAWLILLSIKISLS